MVGNNRNVLSDVKKFLFDASYYGEPFAQKLRIISGAEVEIVKRNDSGKFFVMPQRWVVERTFGWFDKYRRIWKNCERSLHHSCQMLNLTSISILLRRF